MPDDPAFVDDPQYAELFAVREQALMSGASSSDDRSTTLPEVERQLNRDLACAQLLRQALRPAAPQEPAGPPRSSLGRFRILGELGRGGFGIVFLAHDPLLNREVAVKVPRPEVLLTPELRQRFQREARAVSPLDHPNLVPVYEVGDAGPLCYIVSAYSPGLSLAEWLSGRSEPVPVRDAAELVATLAEAVGYAHARGVVHRDLKPQNVLLALQAASGGRRPPVGDPTGDSRPPLANYTPKITDFGLAKNLLDEQPDGQTRSGAIVGTPAYMAPEQAAGKNREIGPPADVWALGAILYELLTGRPPFRGEAAVDTLVLVRTADPVPPHRLRPKVPRDLETVCLKCLQKEPHRRYPRATGLAEDLRRFLSGAPVLARPAGPAQRLIRWCRRNPALGVAAGVAAAALLGVVALAVSFAVHQSRAASRLLEEQEQTRAALEKAEKHSSLAERRSALLALDRGLTLCEQGNVGRGMLWLAQSLETSARLPAPEAGDLQRLTRAHLAAWRCRLRPLRALLAHPSKGVSGGAFSPDGRTIVTTGWDTTARLWEASTGKPIDLLRTIEAAGSPVAFSPDGKRILATGAEGGTARIWDVATASPTGPTLRQDGQIWGVAFSPDGRTVLTGSLDETARLWEVATGKPIGPLLQHHGGVVAVAFSPDGKAVLTGSWDKTARLWEAATGKPIGPPLRHKDRVWAVAFSPDGKLALTGSEDRAVSFWDAATGKPAGPPLQHPAPVITVAFGPDGKAVLTGCNDRMARLWSVTTRKPIGVPLPHPDGVGRVAFSPDGRAVLTVGGGEARLWEVVPDPPPAPPLEHPDWVRALSFRPDGRVLVTGCQDGLARFWDLATGKQTGPPLPHKGRVLNVAFSPDGKTVLTGGYDGAARVWDPATGKPLGLPMTHEGQINGLAWSPDGRTIVTVCGHCTMRFWEAATGKPLPLAPLKLSDSFQAVAWSPDGRALVTAAGSAARLWDPATATPISNPVDVRGGLRAVAFSPDGRTLLTGSTQNARLWDVTTRRPVGPPLPHQRTVSAVGFSPDGKIVVTGSYDRTARLWEAATGKPIGPPLVHESEVADVAFSPDGRTVVTGSYDRTARLWPVPPPVAGEAEQVRVWVEVLTGLELDEDGVIRTLDAPTWEQRRRRLERLGGPPMP
jgi:WD40 repeat protein